LSNALKFSQNGKIIIKVCRLEYNMFAISVLDEGIGMKKEEKIKLF